jgi:transcriptional regulator with XRE-family HTH domain
MEIFFKEWRQYRGMTQDQVAKILGMTKSAVSKIELKQRDFSGQYLEAYAEAVGCQHYSDPICRPPPKRVDRDGNCIGSGQDGPPMSPEVMTRMREIAVLLSREKRK